MKKTSHARFFHIVAPFVVFPEPHSAAHSLPRLSNEHTATHNACVCVDRHSRANRHTMLLPAAPHPRPCARPAHSAAPCTRPHALAAPRLLPRGTIARAANGDAPPPPKPPVDDELWIERELRARKRKRDAASKATAGAAKADGASSSATPGALTGADALEQNYVRFLGAFFAIILLDGVVLATSGFLPEAVDVFAENVLYPSFSPLIGVFLLCSSLYGLWKAGSQGGVDKL